MPQQEDIDDNYTTDPGIDRVSQEVWGLRYIDDAVFRRSYNPDIMEEEPEAHHYHVTDAQFSTIAMIGTGANPVLFERARYRPYGEATHRFPGDFNDDSYCNSADQTLLTNALNATIGQGGYDVAIDLNRDGVINSTDQTQFNFWSGRTPLAAGRISDAGSSTAGPGPDNPLGYCGYVFNAETLLYTVRFRHYQPVSGRWMERDPAGYVNGQNLYEYAMSASVVAADAHGLDVGWANRSACDDPWGKAGTEPESAWIAVRAPTDPGPDWLTVGSRCDTLEAVLDQVIQYSEDDYVGVWMSAHGRPGEIDYPLVRRNGETLTLELLQEILDAIANPCSVTEARRDELNRYLGILDTLFARADSITMFSCNTGRDRPLYKGKYAGVAGRGQAFVICLVKLRILDGCSANLTLYGNYVMHPLYRQGLDPTGIPWEGVPSWTFSGSGSCSSRRIPECPCPEGHEAFDGPTHRRAPP